MRRKTKLMLNSASSLIYQLTTIICGFILPRYFLTCYGSDVNGLVSSITQFLGFITLAECGVGPVVQSSLYKPLANQDMEAVSKVVASSERFFKRIAFILLGYASVLMVVYPFITIESFDYLYTFILILVISISTFAQYYIGMTYKLLLEADQLGFFQYTIHVVSLILNTVLCIVLMKCGASVQVVKLGTSLIFVLQPVSLAFIAKRRYKLIRKVSLQEEPIKQKWNAMAQHISAVVLGNTDVVVLTLFSTLDNVSVYTVYHLVVNGVKQIIVSTTNGVRAMFGNMLAKNELRELNRSFDNFEWLIHTLVTLVFSVTAVLIIPFVRVYTARVTDVEYILPVFAYVITLAQATYCYRLPYIIMVNAAGHYKETQWSAVIEAVINVVTSILFVFRFGLVGVAIGTFLAMLYRTVYLVFYLKKNILHRKVGHFVKHLAVDGCLVLVLFAMVSLFPSFFSLGAENYLSWAVLAGKVGALGVCAAFLVNGIFYGKKVKQFLVSKGKRK